MSSIFGWTTTTFDKLLITDCIRQGDVQPKYAVSCIKKKLYATNPHVVLYTLQVLESCMKNCGNLIHAEVASRPFMEELKDLVKTTTNENVRNRILELVQVWAHVFRNESKYRSVQDIYNMLKMEGYKFQAPRESEAMFVAYTAPEWADGSCCHRCRTQFTVVQRKHHCRNCGQIFCHKCSSRTCPIPRFGIEKDVRVCEGCWENINKPLTTVPKSVSPNPEQSPTSSSQESSGPKSKSAAELKEEEDLQLALALSQSEAETKEKQKSSKSSIYSYAPAPEESTVPSVEKKVSPVDSELDRYLNRSYWETRQQQQKEDGVVSPTETRTSPTPSAPISNSAPSNINNYGNRITEKYQNGEVDELTDFLANLRTTVEIFVNRMKSNSSRGRPIANDTHVQSLFMNITNMHSQLLKYVNEQDDLRAYYERLQDKLNQARDARAALDALREEHREKIRQEAEEAERIRQIQMAQKLEIMRKKKQEYLQYQRQLALQRMQEQEREMQMRQEQHKQQYQVVPPQVPQAAYPPQATYGPAAQSYTLPHNGGSNDLAAQQQYHPSFEPQQMPGEYRPPYNMQVPVSLPHMPSGAPFPQQPSVPTSVPMGPQMMMPPPPQAPMMSHMGMMQQGVPTPMMQQQQQQQPAPVPSVPDNIPQQQSPQHQPPPPQNCDPLIVFD
ncbi:hepatocyte growth factor-regulated tyrosine kinase substrate [Caerostris extrusa]|uniref:Hepatocyte growth factor-regulated tyrosine kinase substrate n=1 Tax=Caerostris extrusa TaxID=172846 RepID=A0AAV4WZ08_CAEEX|nr:hepatocyte growth factor-regulated tyrosine kinase substrate [Caerostris extrusa]